jgi:hypothetical protein
MKRKPIRIDWDELEAAFNNKSEDLVYYMDLVTGEVLLEGEGEGEAFDEDKDLLDDAGETATAVRPATTRLYVEPPDADEELSWMDDFVEGSPDLDDDTREALRGVLDQNAPDAFRDALRDLVEVKDKWFLYRSDRLHQAIDDWLEKRGVQGNKPAPWK